MYSLDERIQNSCFSLGQGPLSEILLKNEKNYPWIILVPMRQNISEIYQLEQKDRELLMEEIAQLGLIMKDYFRPQKLNIGSLGNIVSQLHIHLVARQQEDALWPHGIWQDSFINSPYEIPRADALITELTALIRQSPFLNNSLRTF